MEETKIEKLEEVQPKIEYATKTDLEEVNKKIEAKFEELKALLPKKEEMAEKKTVQKASNTNDEKILKLQRQYRHLGNDAIKHLVMLKDNRKFEMTEDGLTVKEVEEKW